MSKSIEHQHLQLRNTSLLNFQASITLLTKGTAPLPQVTYRTYRSILLEHLQQLHHLSRSNWKLWLWLSRSVAVAWCVDCVAMCRLLTLLLLKGHCQRLVSIIAWLCSLRWSMLAQQICVSLHHLNCPHLFPSSASGSMLSKSKALGKWCLVERSWHFNPCSNKTLRPNDSKKTRRSSMNLCTCLTHYLWGVPNGTCLQVKILHLAVLQGCLTCWDQGIDPPEIGGEDHFHCEAFTWDGQSISMDSKWPWRNPDYLKLANHHQSPQSGAICLIML